MECVPAEIARLVSESLKVPTISYGAGPNCDCQGLVSADVLGMFDAFLPKFSRRYAELGLEVSKAFSKYRDDVIAGNFPGKENCYGISAETVGEIERLAAQKEKNT